MSTVVVMANSISELGGATRVAHVLAEGLASRGHDVCLIGLESAAQPHAFAESSSVRRATLLSEPVPSASDEEARREAEGRILTGLGDLLAQLGGGTIITTQVWCKEMLDRVDHAQWRVIGQYHSSAQGAVLTGDVERLVAAYADADAVTLLTEGDARTFADWGLPRTMAMPNPLAFWPDRPSPLTDRVVTYLGRLSAEKAPGILADAWDQVAGEMPDWRLRFVGSGPLLEDLWARSLPRVQFVEPTANPQAYLLSSSILALPSLVEGLPLALMEAMGCGVPAVAADASAGVRELIDGTGLLAVRGDSADFGQQLRVLMSDDGLRARLGAQGRVVAESYRLEVILDRWENLLARG